MSVFVSEHVRTLVMLYLVFIVHDVRAKIEASDISHYREHMIKLSMVKRVAYTAVIVVSIL